MPFSRGKSSPHPLFPLGKPRFFPHSPRKKDHFSLEIRLWTAVTAKSTDKKDMSFQTSFKHILREKMNETAGAETQNSSARLDSDPAHLAYLMSQVGKFHFNSPRGQYPRPPVRPAKPRPAHNLSSSQKLSFEFLKTYIHDLSEGFTATELKKAFRQTALALHPDHGGTPAQFIELKTHYESLTTIFAKE